MMGLRKFFVLSAASALALIGSGTALGQFCQIQRGGAGAQVRAEGLSERTSNILMVCTAGIVEDADDVKITVTLSDGALITNPVRGADNNLIDTIYATQYVTTAEYNLGTRDPDQLIGSTKLKGGGSVVEMVIKDWRATASGNTLRLKINGIHINAAAVGTGNTVRATVELSNIQFFGNDTANIARPFVGLKPSLVGHMMDDDSTVGTGTTATVNEPVQGLTCTASKKTDDATLEDDEDATIARIEVKEGFATAFKKSDSTTNVRIRLSFNDIPAGVDAYLRPMPDCSWEAGGTGYARDGAEGSYTYRDPDNEASTAAAHYLELTLQSGLDSSGAGTSEAAVADDDDDGYVKVNLSGGSGTAVYDITADGGGGVDNCEIPIAFVWGSGVDRGSAGTVSASFAPVSTVAKAATTSTPWLRFTASGSPIEVITFEDCSTTLLFPFVTNQAGYDTGIAISNTSKDSFGTTENDGECRINYYGSMMGGGAAPDEVTSNSVEAGGQLVFLLSAGNSEMGVEGAAGFQGYLMARCSFQFAHGLAFITGPDSGAPSLAHGYLALVVPARQGNRGVGGNGFEQLNN